MTRSTIPVTIPFAYSADFIGRGCRVARKIFIQDQVTVHLTQLDDQDAPISFRVSKCGRFDVREEAKLDIRTALGHHWRPIGSYDGEPNELAAFISYLQRGCMSAGKHVLHDAAEAANVGPGRIVSDERAEALAQTERRVAKLMVVAGQVWEHTPEPVWVIHHPDRHTSGFSALLEKETDIRKPANSRFVFPINAIEERDAALAEFNRHKQLPPGFEPLHGEIEILRAENVFYRHDEEPRLRGHLASHLGYAGEQVRRTIDTISLEAFAAYRVFIASLGEGSPVIDLVGALRTFNDAIANEPGWNDWHSRTTSALDDWDRFNAVQADELAIGLSL